MDPRYRRQVTGSLLRQWSETVLTCLALPEGTALEIAVTDDETIRRLNREYRGLDEPTDVLSFPFTEQAAPAPFYGGQRPEVEPFSLPPSAPEILGEIVISFPYARRQGRPIRDEIALLLVHGILHLLGHDHQEPEPERLMTAKTGELLGHLK